jgi:hypothetical protein
LLNSARFYEAKQRWHITLFLLMPDHLHALLSFASDQSISKIVGHWKHFQSRKHGIIWQEGYFDHRLRDDERGEQLSAKMNYIRHNPVAAGLCTKELKTGPGLSSAQREVDRAVLAATSMMLKGGSSSRRRGDLDVKSGGEAAII